MRLPIGLAIIGMVSANMASASQAVPDSWVTDEVQSVVKEYVWDNVPQANSVSVNIISAPKSVEECMETLNITTSSQKVLGRTRWTFSCSYPKYIYRVLAYSEVVVPVAVLKSDVRRKDVISASDLEISTERLSRDGGYLYTLQDFPSAMVKRSLRARAPLQYSFMYDVFDLAKGSDVTLQYVAAGIRIEVAGRLVDDARYGQRVDVTNVESGQVVSGLLDKSGVVHIAN
ncbi:flagellar basal body P-ring formation chaperone FlgA [Vibrio breoganii]